MILDVCDTARQMRHQSAMLDVEVGALLLPFWVCDYTLQGGDYRAFVNGFSGQVGGTSHVDSFRAEAASGAITMPHPRRP